MNWRIVNSFLVSPLLESFGRFPPQSWIYPCVRPPNLYPSIFLPNIGLHLGESILSFTTFVGLLKTHPFSNLFWFHPMFEMEYFLHQFLRQFFFVFYEVFSSASIIFYSSSIPPFLVSIHRRGPYVFLIVLISSCFVSSSIVYLVSRSINFPGAPIFLE